MKVLKLLVIIIPLFLYATVAVAQDAFSRPNYTASSEVQERRDQPVTFEDLAILEGAEKLLTSSVRWNRNDDRVCDDDEANDSRSLFCALLRASIDVLGNYNHRRVALQEVRFAIEDAVDTSGFAHRLRDFNNLPETTLEDVRGVLAVAKQRVSERISEL